VASTYTVNTDDGRGVNVGREYRFVQVDVFTERVFGGNPLAVVFEAAGLSDVEMQSIAREMNCSETTFLVPPTRPECAARVRIFTPAREVPFAGHPTIGTSWVLATEKRLPTGATRFNLEEGIGPVEVTLEGDPARPSFLWMRHGEARFGPELTNRAGFAAALGLAEADLLAGAPVCTGSTGSTFLYIPLRDRETVDRARLDVPALLAAQGAGPKLGVFVFAPDPDNGIGPSGYRVYSRMFAPHTSGVPEDPATGSASGPLGAYLVERGLVAPAATVEIVSEQGTRMGRPSLLQIRIGMSGGRIHDIQVGGSVVPVIEGRLRIP
jgi:trans-2,3-dihydro-3-hydroxyanthranilate isomerase